MKVRYIFPLDRPMHIEDHWTVPLLGGECRLVEDGGLVTAIEFSKGGLPPSLAFSVIDTPGEVSKATIIGNDAFLPLVRDQIKRAFSYLQCFFNTDISVHVVDVFHEAETPEEASLVKIPSFKFGKKDPSPLELSFDLITRSLMAAEEHEAPEFVSALVTMARDALVSQRFIDSFRFSFLLIESLFGGGKFKSDQLKQQLVSAGPLVAAIKKALVDWTPEPKMKSSKTLTLLKSGPTPEDVADHLVVMRGHYFHGNLAKPDAWHPAKQEEAQALASITLEVVQVIASDAAASMFEEKYSERHFSEAKAAGAVVKMEVTSLFRMPGDDEFLRQAKHNVNVPGTKTTSIMAMEVAWRSVQDLRNQIPVARLHSMTAKSAADGDEVFHLRILTEPDGPVMSVP